MAFDITKITFAQGFNPTEMVVLHDDGRSPICAFRGTLSGRDLFNIRQIYEKYGVWNPGKGLSVPYEHKASFLNSLEAYIKTQFNA
jgi:hypothetical protein